MEGTLLSARLGSAYHAAASRAKAVTNNFGSQWMQVRNMRASTPDSGLFPEFDESLRAAFQRETDLFLESLRLRRLRRRQRVPVEPCGDEALQ